MTDSDVRVTTSDTKRDDVFGVRKAVFVDEQDVDEELEWDKHDDPDVEMVHFVVSRDGDTVGATRLREYEPGVGKTECVVVLESACGEGWGRRFMEALEAEVRERGFDPLLLHGQTIAEGLYHGLGYEVKNDEFDEAGISYIGMRKSP